MKRLAICTLIVMLMPACHRPASLLRRLERGMTRDQVAEKSVLGAPNAVKGVMQNKHGELVEVWEYRLKVREYGRDRYWLYFVDGELLRWSEGEDKDWSEEEERIYENRFGPE